MNAGCSRVWKAALLLSSLFFIAIPAFSQTAPRVLEPVDNSRRITLTGNVHPLARAEFDRGTVTASQPMNRILLLLKRSDAQEAALETFLEQQQDKSSPNYHQWLTPSQFGAQYGPADADIQAVTQWLLSQGFAIEKVYSGKTVIEFSGNAAQVQSAFGASIHSFEVNGKTYVANANDPQIPAALAPVVAGIVSLNNFPRQYHVRVAGQARRVQGQPGLQPLFTFPNPSGGGSNFYGVGPGDFATIYNSKALIAAGNDGTGQTIAIVGETNINVSDVQAFRQLFGLSSNFTSANIILNGEDPGITSTGEEGEADLDTQWSGAVAPGATVTFVVSASTPASQGIDLSALYIIEYNLAGIMSESYGNCETTLGTGGNAFYNSLWQQAAAQGITAILSAGDAGSAGCDDFNTATSATLGLAVSGMASTPYNLALGGTDFDDVSNASIYWNATNTSTGASALGYIPEIPWNQNCAQLGLTGCGSSAPQGSLNIVAGSGGASGVYAKPSWQMGVSGMPNDSHRDLPDLSLFASPGFDGSGYIVCQADATGGLPCSLTAGEFNFLIVGGTSASAPTFAGVIALVNQYEGAHGGSSRQGNANYTLYPLSKKSGASCASSATEAAGCIFNDVTHGNSYLVTKYPGTIGTNSVPCQGSSPNCNSAVSGVNGVLVEPANANIEAYTAGAGYDLATGLGSVNINNLATKWGTVNTVATTTTLTLSPTTGITHGFNSENVTVNIIVTPTTGTATGEVSLIATLSGPNGATTQGLDQFTLDSTGKVVNGTTNSLPGGTSYQVYGHYAGDGTNAPSDSAPVTVTVGKETSQTFIVVPTFNSKGGSTLNGNATTFVYGTPYSIQIYVTDKNGKASLTGPPNPTCSNENLLTCPTGTVTLTANGPPIDGGSFTLSGGAIAMDISPSLGGGTYALSGSYSGDNSYGSSVSATDSITITPAPTSQQWTTYPIQIPSGQQFPLGVSIGTGVAGVAPTGTVTFSDGNTPLSGPVTYSAQGVGSNVVLYANGTVSLSTAGHRTLTAQYSGDANYAASTSPPVTVVAQYLTTTTEGLSATTINYGQTIAVTVTVSSTAKTPPMTGQVQFSGPGTFSNVVTTPSTDASGNQILTASATALLQASGDVQVTYPGDANYAGSSAAQQWITVNTPDFTMPASASITVTAGQTATTTIIVTPLSNVPSPVTLKVQGSMYGGMNLTFNPNPVNLNGSPVPVTVSLTTTGPSSGATVAAVKAQIKKAGLFGDPRRGWWSVSLTSALLVLYFAAIPARRKIRAALLAGMICALTLVLGCGGGGGISGGGGGSGSGGGPVPTNITITTSNPKVAASGGTFTLTATVTSSKPVTGTVIFTGVQAEFPYPNGIPVTNGVATYTVTAGATVPSSVGTYSFTAQYSGDANNQPSQTATGVNEVLTGTTSMIIEGDMGTLSHVTGLYITLK
jgi:subtilase family serine protease